MKLGVVVTDKAFAPQAVGLLEAAQNRNWETQCFLTDTGIRLLEYPPFEIIIKSGRSKIILCETSINRYEAKASAKRFDAYGIMMGGQFQNAQLVDYCDRVLVL